jgi:hypothetical protein
VEGEPYPTLLQDKGFRGFPSLAFMDAEGEVIHTQGDRSVAGFQRSFTALDVLAKIDEKAAADDPAAATKLFLAKLALDKFEFEAAVAERAKLTAVTDEEALEIEEMLTNLEVQHVMKEAGRDRAAAGKRFAAMYADGKVPTGFAARAFFSAIMAHAEAEGDADLFEQAMDAMKEALDHDPRYKRYYDEWAKTLEKLRG